MTSGKGAVAPPPQGSSPSCSSDTYQALPDADRRAQQDCDALLDHARDAATGCQATPDTAQVTRQRQQHIGPNHALMYAEPLHIVRGEGATLWAADGSAYLDCVNNVAHVGHCHPKVATAVAQQMFRLNTNSRYLHENFSSHAEQLTATMPEPLSVMYATCSGSESNDLALRVARANSPHGARHVVVMDGAYHGHTTATIDLSPYKFNGPGGSGKPEYVHIMPCPDVLRGRNLDGGAAARDAIGRARAAGGRVCAFFSESILSCGGQVVLPDGYLAAVYKEMRAEGAACVADEVQCGFGRVGSHFWGFETQGVVPDMVTLGKPIGNGFPMGAVVMCRRLAEGFDNGMQYFATCGGCTASGAAGLAVLQVLREEKLQAAALATGAHLKAGLARLQEGRPFLGDVRGLGLMLGIECISDAASKAPAPKLACWVRESMKARRVLLTTDGMRCDNILKIKPPLVFSCRDADRLVAELEAVLEEFAGLPAAERATLLEGWAPPSETPAGVPAPEALAQAPMTKRQKV
jgi:ethanolamine-phosphate phospho-lyase